MGWMGSMKEKRRLKRQYKQYEKALRRAWFWEMTLQKKKAIHYLEHHMESHSYEEADLEGSGWLKIGYLYMDMKDYSSAAKSFEKGLRIAQHLQFPYSSYYVKVIDSFDRAGWTDLVEEWLADFAERTRYDQRFARIEKQWKRKLKK